MGTWMELLVESVDADSGRSALSAARSEVRRLEELMSRFQRDSELSRLNRDRTMQVGPDLMRVLQTALEMRQRTGGRFDPTVGRAVVAAGYDRTFDAVPKDTRDPVSRSVAGGSVLLELKSQVATLGEGVDLDLGAIAKGDAADRACHILSQAGPCLVNAGGDIAVSCARSDGPWPVGVPGADGEVVLNLSAGALATSGTDRRRWSRAGRQVHHAISPESGLSAETDVVRATAVASTGAEADAFATALVVAGAASACELANEWGIPAMIVSQNNTVSLAGGLG